MKTIISPTGEAVRAAAERLLAAVKEKNGAVIALDAEEAVLCVLRSAAALARERGVCLRASRFFAVCALEGLPPRAENSPFRRIAEALSSAADGEELSLYAPDAADPAAYDALLAEAGGVDLALLGLGENARVGFNEPATPFDTHTHLQKLTDRTRRELAPLFGGEEGVPPRGVTMGFRELCAAKDIVVIALGEKKSKAVFHMLYGRDDSVYPAAFLQLPPNVTLFADTEAAKQLGEKSFDAVAFNGA